LDERGYDRPAGESRSLEPCQRAAAGQQTADAGRPAEHLVEGDRDEVRMNNFFAYAAQSNFSGVQPTLEWIERAHGHGWNVLLDAAAYVPTNRLDLGHC
jgi:selenocysteine lyase/cysteine desulfurase